MSKESKNSMGLHLFYGIVPLFVYYGVMLIVYEISKYMWWDNSMLNLVNQVANLVVLYVSCYWTYELRGGDRRLPALLPFSKKAAKGEKGPLRRGTYVWFFLIGFYASIALNNWFVIFRLNEKITTYKEVAQNIYYGGFIIVFVKTVLLAALVEELLMRGLVYRGLSMCMGRICAMVVSAAIFGVFHGNLLQGMYAFLLGMVFAFVYDLSGRRLNAPILAHMSANLVSVLGTMLPVVSAWMARYFYLLTLVSTVLFVVSIFMAVWFARGERRQKS